MNVPTVSANILVLNEIENIKGLVENLLAADIDEILFLDGGSEDGTTEYLKKLSDGDQRIKLYEWPQPAGSAYRKDFNEVGRRNFLIGQSTSDFILYIDADERISTTFKSRMDPNADVTAVSLRSYWGKSIRVNSPGDQVWHPIAKYRIFRRNRNLQFSTSDKNGLHTYLAYRGMKVPMLVNRLGTKQAIAKLLLSILPIKTCLAVNSICIYHYHYYFLKAKCNDLRNAELGWEIRRKKDIHLCAKNTVYVDEELALTQEAVEITDQYWLLKKKNAE